MGNNHSRYFIERLLLPKKPKDTRSNEQARRDLAHDIDEFLRQGKRINVIPSAFAEPRNVCH